MEKKSKILITGGAGFIGSNLCEYFINEGQDPTFKFEEMEESAFQYCVSNNKINYIDFFMCKVPNKKDYMYDYIKKYATFNIKSRYLTDTLINF